MTRTDKQVHDEMTEASSDQTIQFSGLDSMLALMMKDPTSSPSPVGYRGNGQHQQFGRAHYQQHSPSDLGCNISTGNTRSSDVLDLPLSGVTLVIGRIFGPYDNEDGYYNEGEDDFYHGDRNSDYYRR
ncbi:hypothetical protein D6C76_06160 [Aureobasidium pullulans]|uniref:Uncharacterized protein n=1 Tax=Aureobasidium pullulans TaxID=5580 RepID=A0A4T0ALV4_AURPU|nr:hypothetical protein D6C83_08197 [Aureobasidium pullulans]TIA41562.1 hypothetical protein D6C79_07221 [Aureobasidium pullulans]TIA74954.1 hypothetical protein D6C76_06160 [Aureobasidium pullulans]